MKKLGIVLFLVFISYQMIGIEFRDNAFKINAAYDESLWTPVKGEKYRDRLTLRHLNLPATINILAYRFNESITANGLVQKRIQSVYDGWQLLNEHPISELQAKQKNITEGIRSIYRKTYLDDTLNEQYVIAGDICFVTEDTLGIVLNISVADPETLLEVKTAFNKVYTSLWMGDEKPTINFVVNNDQEWVMDNQNLSRKRFFNTNFKLNETVNISKKIDVNERVKLKGIKTYNNNNGEYILTGSDLFFIHPVTHRVKQMNLDMNEPELILTQDGFYVIQKYPRVKIKKYTNDFHPTFEYEDSQHAIKIFTLNGNLVIIDPQNIKLLKGNDVVWALAHEFDIYDVVAEKDQLVIADKNDTALRVIDLNKGVVIKEVTSTRNTHQQFKDMAINQSKALVIVAEGRLITQMIIELDDYTVEDQVTKAYDQFEVAAITNELIIIKYKNDDREWVLEALDFNTFASVWVLPFDNYAHTVISNHHILSINEATQLVAFELKTAQKNEGVNIKQLMNPNVATEDAKDVTVFGLMPIKNKLLAIIEQGSSNSFVYLR